MPTYIGVFNRAQQAYFLENQSFTDSFAALRLDDSKYALNYRYTVNVKSEAVSTINAIPRHPNHAYREDSFIFFSWKTKVERPMTAYVGGVFIIKNASGTPQATEGIICRSNQPGIALPAQPILSVSELQGSEPQGSEPQGSEPNCSLGTEKIGSS